MILDWQGAQWSVAAAPVIGAWDALYAVVAVSEENAWAVGAYTEFVGSINKDSTLIEHWNGKEWSILPSPNQPVNTNILYSVCAISADDLWAVGTFRKGPEERAAHPAW